MHVAFAIPQALGLLLTLPLIALIALLASRRAFAHDWLALGVRLAIVTATVLALAQPSLGRASTTLSVVFAVDASDSLGPDERARALAFVQQALGAMGREDRAGIVAFGKEATVLRPIGPVGRSDADQPLSVPDGLGEGTDVAAGLQLAASLLLPDGARRIVLVGDGQDNSGRVQEEARQLAARGIQVVTVPVGKIPDPEVVVDGIEVAQYTREEEPIDLAVTVESSRDAAGELRIWLDGDLVLSQQIELKVGGNRYSTMLEPLPRGFHALKAQVFGAPDTYPQNNEWHAYTVVKPAARVLMVAANPEAAAPLQGILGRNGFQVDVQSPRAIPSSLAPLRGYDGMVLADVPASEMTLDQMRTVQGFVEGLGRGLLVTGGESSYGMGGYENTPLDEILPVKVKSPSRTEIGQVAMVLVIDKSGSMEERLTDRATKISAARQAGVLATDALSPQDYLGVIAFDSESRWLIQPGLVGDEASRSLIRNGIQALRSSGGTELHPALVEAHRALQGIQAQYKHIIAMTDGVSYSRSDYDALFAQMRADNITVSTIAIGRDADQALLTRLAELGEGSYYFTERAGDIPEITVRETQLASGSPKLEGDVAAEVRGQSPILRSLPTNLPLLKGIAVATPRDTAMTALATQRGDALLAHWQRGLGRVVAWTSDLGAKWAADWASRPDLERLWTQALRWSFASPQTSGLYIRGSDDGESIRLQVEAVDDAGALLSLLDLRARIGEDTRDIPLVQVAPGRYEARIALPGPGAYHVSVTEHAGGNPTARAEEGGIVVHYPREYRHFGPNESLLASIGATTGGGTLSGPESAFARQGLRFAGLVTLPLWPYLLGLAALLFPLDVGIRRLRLSPGVLLRPIGGGIARMGGIIPFRRRPRGVSGEETGEGGKAA